MVMGHLNVSVDNDILKGKKHLNIKVEKVKNSFKNISINYVFVTLPSSSEVVNILYFDFMTSNN